VNFGPSVVDNREPCSMVRGQVTHVSTKAPYPVRHPTLLNGSSRLAHRIRVENSIHTWWASELITRVPLAVPHIPAQHLGASPLALECDG